MAKYMVKGEEGNRLFSKKVFFSSRNLVRPIVVRNENNILDYIRGLEKSHVVVCESAFLSHKGGRVTKKTYESKE